MPKPASCHLLLAGLFLLLSSIFEPTRAQTRPDSSFVTIPSTQARIILADLQRYPLVLGENKRLRGAIGGYEANNTALRREIVAKDTVIAATSRRVVVAKVLGRDAENRAAQWKAKAHSRFWLLVSETALLLGGFLLAAGR